MSGNLSSEQMAMLLSAHRQRIDELEQDLARARNAQHVTALMRDHYKGIAELNAETIKGMQAARNEWPREPMDE